MRYLAGSSNGRTHASGACYLGSSPSPAAEFAFFTSAAFHTKKAQVHFADASLETQEGKCLKVFLLVRTSQKSREHLLQ